MLHGETRSTTPSMYLPDFRRPLADRLAERPALRVASSVTAALMAHALVVAVATVVVWLALEQVEPETPRSERPVELSIQGEFGVGFTFDFRHSAGRTGDRYDPDSRYPGHIQDRAPPFPADDQERLKELLTDLSPAATRESFPLGLFTKPEIGPWGLLGTGPGIGAPDGRFLGTRRTDGGGGDGVPDGDVFGNGGAAVSSAWGVRWGRGGRGWGCSGCGYSGLPGPRSIVYVVDCSGSMDRVGDFLLFELGRAVNRLNSTQKFNILWFGDGGPQALEASLLNAGEENKLRLYFGLHEVEFAGETDPRGALELAVALKPELIYFLTDGEFNADFVDEIIALITGDNGPDRDAPATRINVVGFTGGCQRGYANLRRLAAAGRGRFKLIDVKALTGG